MNGRVLLSDEDCADCLCRVCANNQYNDAWNPGLAYGYKSCVPCECCRIGITMLVEIDDDCPSGGYLPDVDDMEDFDV